MVALDLGKYFFSLKKDGETENKKFIEIFNTFCLPKNFYELLSWQEERVARTLSGNVSIEYEDDEDIWFTGELELLDLYRDSIALRKSLISIANGNDDAREEDEMDCARIWLRILEQLDAEKESDDLMDLLRRRAI